VRANSRDCIVVAMTRNHMLSSSTCYDISCTGSFTSEAYKSSLSNVVTLSMNSTGTFSANSGAVSAQGLANTAHCSPL
jgi:hypothetical protein